jgi:hypothetical protein
MPISFVPPHVFLVLPTLSEIQPYRRLRFTKEPDDGNSSISTTAILIRSSLNYASQAKARLIKSRSCAHYEHRAL